MYRSVPSDLPAAEFPNPCCFLSDKLLIQVLRDGTLSKKSYLVSKFDALFNAVMGFAFAVILVL